VRLLTFNTLMRNRAADRLRALAGELERSDFDIVCLQEVMWRSHYRLLRRLSPSYRYGACSGTALLRGGLVLLSRWPIVEHSFHRYPITGPVRPELLMRKGAQVATVAIADARLTVINTHLSANPTDDWSNESPYTRVQAVELTCLARLVASVAAETPVVVAGDLNVPRSSTGFAALLAHAGLQDTMAGYAGPTYRPTAGWPNPPALDHVLVRTPRDRAVEATAQLVFERPVQLAGGRETYLSDHFGVAVRLTWRG